MAHHGTSPLDSLMPVEDQLAALRRGVHEQDAAIRRALGATGRFPRGKLVEHDEGETRIAIGQRNGAVVMDFGNPTAWIGFTPEQADEIATSLTEHAREIRLRR